MTMSRTEFHSELSQLKRDCMENLREAVMQAASDQILKDSVELAAQELVNNPPYEEFVQMPDNIELLGQLLWCINTQKEPLEEARKLVRQIICESAYMRAYFLETIGNHV